MIDPSDVRRMVERALVKAIEMKIHEKPLVDPEDIVKASLSEFNKAFEGVYKIDKIKRTKDFLGISVIKDKGHDDEELVNA